jgi:opacity protein-like surface antigen
MQVGADIATLNFGNSGANLHIGLTSGYLESKAKDISREGPSSAEGTFKGSFQVPFAGIYTTLTAGNFFADSQVRWDFYQSQLSDAIHGLFRQSLDAQGISATGNVGYRFDVGSNWFVEPSVGGTWSRLSVDPLNDAVLAPSGVFPGAVQINDVESTLGRASLRIGTSFTAGNFALQPFATASVFREFAGNVTSTYHTTFIPPFMLPKDVDGVQTTSRVGTYEQYGLGVAYEIIHTGWLGYARVDYRTGEKIEGVSGNIGLRYQFDPPPAPAAGSNGSSPFVVQAYNWTGLYLGGFGGKAYNKEYWVENSETLKFGAPVSGPDFAGYVLGGQLGYNYQLGWLVLGIEGDMGKSNAIGGQQAATGERFQSCRTTNFFLTCEAEMDALASVAGRVGYAWGRALFYGKAGLAIGEVTAKTLQNPITSSSKIVETTATTDWLTGWTAGGGMEFALSQHWSAKGEWMYYDFGKDKFTVDESGHGVIDAKTYGNAVRIGANYHLN